MGKTKPKTSKRKPGRQKGHAAVVTPEVRNQIEEMRLKALSPWKIGERLGLAEGTIRYQLETYIYPLWREKRIENLGDEIAKVEAIEAVAWERFEKSQEPQTKEQIEKALAEEGADPDTAMQIVKEVSTITQRVGEVSWLSVIQWCIEWRSKVGGYYAPTKHEFRGDGDLRVAGLSTEQIDKAMLDRLRQRVAESRANKKMLEAAKRG